MSYMPPGQPYPGQPYPGYPIPQRTSGLAVGSLVCSLLICVPGVTALVGVILGFCALPAINRGEAKGKGLAIAGIILGLIGLLVLVPLEGFAGYRAYSFGMSTLMAPAKDYARAVVDGDFDAAVAKSAPGWTIDDSKALQAKLKDHGTIVNIAMKNFNTGRGSNSKPVMSVHLVITFSDGKDVVLSVHMVPPQPGGQAFEVGGAEVLP